MSVISENVKNVNEELGFLESTLKELGLYEDGMELEEMRMIRSAVNESIEESSQIFEDELQAALKESEKMSNESLLRSFETSSLQSSSSENSNILYNARSSTPPSSPDHPFTMNVIAEIHSEWSHEAIDHTSSKIAASENDDHEDKTDAKFKEAKLKKLARNDNKADDIYSVLDVSDEKL